MGEGRGERRGGEGRGGEGRGEERGLVYVSYNVTTHRIVTAESALRLTDVC